jgi:hypothetical protein
MELDERIAKIEAILQGEDAIARWERKGIRIAKLLLLIIALAAPVVWALFEFAMFLINRYESFKHALGW